MIKKLLYIFFLFVVYLNAFDSENKNNNYPGEYIPLQSSPFQDSGNVDGSNSDWHDKYYFNVPKDGNVTITLSSNTDLDFKIGTVYDLQDIARQTSSSNIKIFTFTAQANKNYYLAIFDNEWRNQSNPYTLKIEFPSNIQNSSGDGRVTKIYAHYEDATSSNFLANFSRYYWGQAKDLVIDGFEYNGHRYNYSTDSAIVKIRRSDNSNASGNPCGLFAEKNGDSKHLKPTYPQNCDMAKVMSGRIINVGALDLFKNTGYTAKNIERVDFIYPNGITAPANTSDLAKAGHVVTEKSGNNEIKIAAILSIDSNGNPTSFGPLVDIHGPGSIKDYGITTIYLPDGTTISKQSLGFYRNEKNSPQGYPWHVGDSYEPLGMCFVSLQDLGISAGQKYYGFAYFGRDVTDNMNLVDYNSFPKTTDGDTADPYGGVASYFVSEEVKYSINGFVFDDKNHNGKKDSGEGGLNKNTYIKLCQNGNFIDSVKVSKNTDGSYNFSNLPAGSYTLIEDASNTQDCSTNNDVSGWISTTSNSIDVALTQDVTDQNFGNFHGSKISGKVFEDINKNGHLDSGEVGIANVHLVIKRCGNIEFDSTTTDENGNYTFWVPVNIQGDGSVDGWIAVFETDPDGYKSTGDEFDNGNGNQDEPGDAQEDHNWLCFSDRGIDFDDGGHILTGNNFGDITKTNIIADYHFDECLWTGADNEVKDSSGNGFDGKAYGGVTTYDDNKIINRSAKFIKSQGQYIKVTNFTKFNQKSFTASLWVKVHDNVNGWQTILHKGSVNNSSNGVFRIKYNYNGGNDKLGIYLTLKNGRHRSFYKNNVGLKDKKWHHLVVTYKNKKFKVYLDKKLIAKKSYSRRLKAPNHELHIGGKYYKSNMYIDEVKIFDGALSHNEIIKIYNNEKSGKNYDGSVRDSVNCVQSDSICYAIDQYSDYLYTTYVSAGASPLPQATRKALDFSSVPVHYRKSLDGQSQAYNPKDGLIYRFREEDMYFYSIDPETAKVTYIKTFSGLKEWIVGASFYGDYLYVIAKHIDESTLYKIETSNWTIVSQVDVKDDNNRFVDVDSLAINSEGRAYITDFRENKIIKHLYSLDLSTGKAHKLFDLSNPIDLEGLSFAIDDKLYISNSAYGTNKDDNIISMLNLNDGSRVAAAHVPEKFDAHINGLSCNVKDAEVYREPNAMLLTRGDGDDNNKTNVYVFHVDTNTDTISDFHLLKKLDIKFRALAYYKGKFYTADMDGNIYTIDINTGNYTLDTAYGKIDNINIGGMDFDGDGNILYSIWSNSNFEQRKLRKYNPSTGTSIVLATVPISDYYIDYGVAYFGNGKTVVSVGSGAVRFINNGSIGEHIDSQEWCVYGGEYVGNEKGYFVNAESDDLSIYKLDGTNWSKIYTYGSKTSGNKAVAIAVVHEQAPSTPSLPDITVNDIEKYEGDNGVVNYQVTVNLNPPAPNDLTLTYSTEDGTAKFSDSDYQRVSGSMTVPKGSNSVVLTVKVNGDRKVEDDEYFYLNIKLSN